MAATVRPLRTSAVAVFFTVTNRPVWRRRYVCKKKYTSEIDQSHGRHDHEMHGKQMTQTFDASNTSDKNQCLHKQCQCHTFVQRLVGLVELVGRLNLRVQVFAHQHNVARGVLHRQVAETQTARVQV